MGAVPIAILRIQHALGNINGLGQLSLLDNAPPFITSEEYDKMTTIVDDVDVARHLDRFWTTKYEELLGVELKTVFCLTNLLELYQHFGWEHYSSGSISQQIDVEPTATLLLFFTRPKTGTG